MSWVTDGTMYETKSDIRPTPEGSGTNYWAAADGNNVKEALEAVQSQFQNGHELPIKIFDVNNPSVNTGYVSIGPDSGDMIIQTNNGAINLYADTYTNITNARINGLTLNGADYTYSSSSLSASGDVWYSVTKNVLTKTGNIVHISFRGQLKNISIDGLSGLELYVPEGYRPQNVAGTSFPAWAEPTVQSATARTYQRGIIYLTGLIAIWAQSNPITGDLVYLQGNDIIIEASYDMSA